MKGCPASLLVFAGLVFLAGAAVPAAAEPTVGILFKNRIGYWALAEKGAVAAGAARSVNVIVKGDPSGSAPSLQPKLLRALQEERIDVLVVSPIKAEALEEEVRAAVARGVKLVTFDAPQWKSLANVSIETDRLALAKAADGLLSSLVGDRDEVVIFRNNQSDAPIVERENILIQELKNEKPDLRVHAEIFASTVAGEERARARYALEKYPSARAILSVGSAGTMAMLDVMAEKGLAGKIHLVGFGINLNAQAAAALRSGALDGWMAQLPFDFGYLCVNAAADLAEGKPVPKVLEEAPLLVTRANLDDPKVQALLRQ